jgi:hypothetical protein
VGASYNNATASKNGTDDSQSPDKSNIVCRFFERSGDCRLGSSCPYKHTHTQPAVVADAPVRGESKRAADENSGRRICRFFQKNGTCRDGDDCPFLHAAGPVKGEAKGSVDESSGRRICRFFQKNGTCRDGDSCPFVHASKSVSAPAPAQKNATPVADNVPAAKDKTVKCRYFSKNGSCRLGDACTFMHVDERTSGTVNNGNTFTSKSENAASLSAAETGSEHIGTKLCRYFKKNGTCKDGANCAFSHDVAAKQRPATAAPVSRPAPTSTASEIDSEKSTRVCRYFKRSGTCKDGDSCKFLHPAGSKPAPAFGAPAPQAVAVPAASQKDIQVTADEDKKFTKLCRFFKRNECKLGDGCPFIHQTNSAKASDKQATVSAATADNANTDKAIVCRYYKRLGHCKLGANCSFLHSTTPPTVETVAVKVPVHTKTATGTNSKNNDNSSKSKTSAGNQTSGNDKVESSTSKQRVCRYFKRFGTCKQGSECGFLHTQTGTPIDKVLAPQTANTSEAESRDTSTTVCRFFRKNGTCKLGSECRFAHTAAAPAATKLATEARKIPAVAVAPGAVCRYFARNGTCRNGSSCQFVHTEGQATTQTEAQDQRPLRQPRGNADGRHQSRGRPRNKSELGTFISRHAIPFVGSNGNASNGSSNGHPHSNMAKPFLENVLRNNSHKPGFLLEQYVSMVDADKVRILDEYRQPLGVGGFHLLNTTTNPAHNYVSQDQSFNCSFENSYLSVEYTHVQAVYRGKLVVGDDVSVPVDDLIATVSLLHDFLFTYVLSTHQ